jgi:RNA 3'-terminal phosphate cyclase
VLSTGGNLGSATLVFKPAALSGGTNYIFQIRPTLTHHLTRAKIVVTQVVYSLQAWLD